MSDRDTWRWLADDGHALLEALGTTERTAADIARLRKTWTPAQVHAGIALARARQKAARVLDHPAPVADVEGVEVATATVVARHKARRVADAGVARVVDACCGVGGDAIELARVTTVLALDRDPLRAWMAARNAGCPAVCADAESLALDALRDGDAVHIDPARRDGGRRLRSWQDYRPGPELLTRIAAGTAALKLGPGVELDALPPGELELISDGGRLVQAVLWTGGLAGLPASHRRATRLPGGETIHGLPGPMVDVEPLGERVYVADPTLERGGLLQQLADQLGLRGVHPGLGLLTGGAVDSPWLTAFTVEAEMPWRPKRVARWLREHDGGPVELRPRGVSLDHARTRKQLAGKGATAYTVFVQRLDRKVVAIVARRAD